MNAIVSTRKFGFGVVLLHRSISSKQICIVLLSRPASSLTPQRRSMAWNLQPCSSHKRWSLGKTSSWSALRSSFRSEKVELTKRRNVWVEWGMETLTRKICLQGSSSRTKINVSSWNYLMCFWVFTPFSIPVMIAITRMLLSYMASIRALQMTSACGCTS
jgi:hypothetical protein